MKNLTILSGLSMLLFFASCKDKSVTKEEQVFPAQEIHDATAGNEIKILPPQEFHDAIAGKDVQLLDVRTAKEFEEGHVEHSVNIDVLEDDFSEKVKSLNPEKPVYVYCRSGNRSQKASAILNGLGFKEIYDMEGGYLLWESEDIESKN